MRRPDGNRAIEHVRALRRDQTEAEKLLWTKLRSRQLGGAKFRRQVWIAGYIADFFCAEAKLVVELDGGQHADQLPQDCHRTRVIEDQGFRVLRFWNDEVLRNMDGVLMVIIQALTLPLGFAERAPPSPLQGEGS